MTSAAPSIGSQGPSVVTATLSSYLSSASGIAVTTAVAPTATSSSVASSIGSNGAVNVVPGFEDFLSLYTTLQVSLGSLIIGLLFAAITFGAVCTKSMSYFRTSNGNATAIKALVAGLVVINAVQMGVTTAAVVTSVVVDFGHVSALLDNNWTIITQIFFTTLTAAIVQSYFVYRLHHARRCLSLTLVASLFIFVQFVMSIYSVAQTFQDGYVTVMLLQSVDVWALVTTFGISAGVNIVLAAYGHVWLQKPYEIRKNGRTTVIDQVEYWTFKSLFLCGILSAYNAIGVSIFRLNLSWLGFTFILGNLYTLSVILNATEGIYAPVVPIANGSRGPATEADSVRPPSTATLTNDNELWEDIAKNQKIMALEQSAAMTVEKHSEDKSTFVLGYHGGNSVV